MSKGKIPTLFGVFILLLGVSVGVFVLGQQQIFRLGASPEKTPRDVRVTNVTNNSFTVSWVTDKEYVGFVEWGTTDRLGQTATSSSSGASTIVHSVNVVGLNASTTYRFAINSGGTRFDNNGAFYSVSTSQIAVGDTTALSGKVLTGDNAAASGVVVYVTLADSSVYSTVTGSDGEWILPVATQDGSSVLEVFVQAGNLGIATAQVLFSTASSSVPPITLGKVHDFRDVKQGGSGNVPEADIELPGTASRSSRFKAVNISGNANNTPSGEVSLESVDDGEVIFTEKPEFFGDGPKGLELTITVESDPITDTVTVPNSGLWKWSVPENLEPGEHTVTITWRDIDGTLKKLTRTFIVEANAASGDPAFVSTPSATPVVTKTPTPTPKATSTPTPVASSSAKPTSTAKAALSPKPVATKTATPSASLPDAGVGLPSALLLGFGVLLLTGGIWTLSLKNE